MKTKKQYAVLVPLIHLILTGSKEIAIEDEGVKLSEGYFLSMEEYAKGKQSRYFYQCIHFFLESVSQEEKADILKILIENDTLLLAAMMTDQLESKKSTNLNQDSKAIFNTMMFDFLCGNNTDPVIHRTLYFYLENLHRLEVKNLTISNNEYKRVLNFNNQKRSKREIFNMFT
ncbi:hypothetical protein H4K35_00045 [Myroides sp. NP-2]|uniref:hypothetical protein n=1 Tax=Myroides sp. NP-2 TaxID=2759945 RepID=UPI0015FCD3C3|nr:hypothetical protein [Myroides sp. NP-2]MBB1148538.1 hypothetical protein [Myroides sp. NP-2]